MREEVVSNERIKKRNNTKTTNEAEIHNLADKEFKTLLIKRITHLGKE